MTVPVFHEPWWLDAVAPGRWREARVEENGSPVARWPYVERRVAGLPMVVAPPLCSRLGPVTDLGPGRRESRLGRFDRVVDDLLAQLPPADLVRQVLHPDVVSWLPFHRHGFRVEPQISYVLDDLSDLDVVWSGLSGQTRRVIRKARGSLEVVADTTAERLMPMFLTTAERRGLGMPFDAATVERVVAAAVARDRGTVLTAVDAQGTVHASMLGVRDDDRAWYLGGGGSDAGRASGAASLLMWELITWAARHAVRFDFEGSMVPGVGRYFRNFGGRQETCFLVTRTSRRAAPLWAAYRWRSARTSAE